MAVRKSLKWWLIISIGISASVLLQKQRPDLAKLSTVVPAVSDGDRSQKNKHLSQPLTLSFPRLTVSERNPFIPVVLKAEPVLVKSSAMPAVAQSTVPLTAPPLELRFFGSMQDPTGKRLIYLTKGEAAFAVQVGDQTDEGYRVESIDLEGIVLVHPPSKARATIAVPIRF